MDNSTLHHGDRVNWLVRASIMLIPATGRQGKLKRRTFVEICYCPQLPAVGLYKRSADRQSHAQALRLGRIKGVEEMFQALRIKRRTRILH